MTKPLKPPAADAAMLLDSDAAAAEALARIGTIDARLAAIEAKKARHVAKVGVAAENMATPFHQERERLTAELKAFCTADRRRLTQDHRSKTIGFATGECGFREGRGRLVIEPDKKKSVLEKLTVRFKDFVRTRTEIDVAAIGKALRDNPKAAIGKVPGLLWEPPSEEFWVKPAGAELVDRPKPA